MRESQKDKKTKKVYRLVLVCLLLLFNPNINIIDILPDFIAYFILYNILAKASDSAAYFEEAKTAFLRLAYITLSKIPALFLVTQIRSGNTNDTDIFALVTIVYATLELLFLVPAVNNLFEALFHLGERTEAEALIKPFKISKKRSLAPEKLRTLSFIFVISKALLFTLPEFLILTSTTDYGTRVMRLAKFYPYAVVLAQLIGLCIGIIWLSYAHKYLIAVVKEGKFDAALDFMQTEGGRERYEARARTRRLKSSLTALAIASFFSIELVFSNFEDINLLPHFIYGAVLLYAMKKLFENSKTSKHVYWLGALFIVCSAVFYVFSFRFLDSYNYSDLLYLDEAVSAYVPLLVFSVIEALTLIAFLVSCAISLKSFVKMNTGLISPNTERYSEHEKEYHRSIMKRIYVMFSLAGLNGVLKCINVFINRDVQIIMTRPNEILTSSYAASALPWFGTAVFVSSAIYIGYTLYFISNLKDEIDMKHEVE